MENKNIVYDKRTAGGVSTTMKLINEVFQTYDDVRWSSKRNEEFGFYYKDKNSPSDVFLGIWFDTWEQFEIPLCIAINYVGSAPVQKSTEIEKYILNLSVQGLVFKNIDNFPTILFHEIFFDFESDYERICKLYDGLCEFLFPGCTRIPLD